MKTPFYTCGFLYNPKTHQILLLQTKTENVSTPWSMLGGEGMEGEDALTAFQRIINKSLNLNIKSKNTYPVYDYFHNTRNKFNYVFYTEVKVAKKFNDLNNGSLIWVSFTETLKLPVNSQTKQDIIVGERVINAKLRDIAAKKLQQEQQTVGLNPLIN